MAIKRSGTRKLELPCKKVGKTKSLRKLSVHPKRHLLISAIVLVIVGFTFNCDDVLGAAQKQKYITVVLRYDDYSSSSNTALELKLIDAFRKCHVACTFGVIPFIAAVDAKKASPQGVVPLTPEKARILENAMKTGNVEVALHGYSHQTIRQKGDYTEFSGLDYTSQILRLEKGKAYLEKSLKKNITVFIPPWNSYDLNTLLALEKLGFKGVSTSVSTPAINRTSLKFLPATCSILQLKKAVESARRSPNSHELIVAVFHQYDFFGISGGSGGKDKLTDLEFSELIDWLSSQKDIKIMSIGQAMSAVDDLSGTRNALNAESEALREYLPPFLRRFDPGPMGLYLPSSMSKTVKMKRLAFLAALYSGILMALSAFAFLMGKGKFLRTITITPMARYGSLALLIVCTAYACGFPHFNRLSYKGLLILDMLSGMVIGAWTCYVWNRKNGDEV